ESVPSVLHDETERHRPRSCARPEDHRVSQRPCRDRHVAVWWCEPDRHVAAVRLMANNSYGGKNLGHRRRGKLEASVRSAFILTVSMQSVIGHRRTVFVLLYRRVASIRRSDCDPDGKRASNGCRLLKSSAPRRVTTSAGPSVAMS